MSSQEAQAVTYPALPPTLILTSTKAYFTPERTLQYLKALLDPANNILPLPPNVLFGLIPDHLTVFPCSQILSQHASPDPSSWPLYLGAQDVSQFANYGAYTGFVVSPALSSLGVRIVELNHAERRRFVSETDATTADKARAACANGLIPLVCIGEIEKPNLNAPMSQAVGGAMRQLSVQIESILNAVPSNAPVILAYEPVWAIGAAEPAGVDYVGPVVQAIREVVRGFSARTGETRVVYGGSAGPGLWSGKTNGGNGLGQYVDGMFLGRFAHEISGVQKVVEEVKQSLEGKS
jgi:triosephosphate isomerase (TIM)